MIHMAKRWTLGTTDLSNLLKVVIYSGLAAMVVSLLDLLPNVDVPLKYAWLVPLVNVVLVAVKKYFEDTPME